MAAIYDCVDRLDMTGLIWTTASVNVHIRHLAYLLFCVKCAEMGRLDLLDDDCRERITELLQIAVADDTFISKHTNRAVFQIRNRLLFFTGSDLSTFPAKFFATASASIMMTHYINNTWGPTTPVDGSLYDLTSNIIDTIGTFTPDSFVDAYVYLTGDLIRRIMFSDHTDRVRLKSMAESIVETDTLVSTLPNIDGTICPDAEASADLIHVKTVSDIVKNRDSLALFRMAGELGIAFLNCVITAVLLMSKPPDWIERHLEIATIIKSTKTPKIIFIDGGFVGIVSQGLDGYIVFRRTECIVYALLEIDSLDE